ncbi:uncharacterized protein LOC119674728 [Teleopsis dalmanni]|uniref:uncharacterized protein LOC119674728 n=1 Tax=Teleopsis dalmanni TaxID=139649 RepID=UPI0018CF36A5|nr:uncharacterized protein LOC119674728 [Teleopsis dalmanni]
MTFKKDVPTFFLNLRFVLPQKNTEFVILNLTNMNGCELLGNSKQTTLLKIGREHMDRFSNMPRHCPFLKSQVYYIRGFRADMNSFPAFSFDSEFHVFFDFIVQQQTLFKGFILTRVFNKNFKGKLF